MKKLINICFIALFACLFLRCDDIKKWDDPTDDIPPGNVSSATVENISGGVIITYTLPSDNDLLGVKAVYYHKPGEYLESFSSAYTDTIKLYGFPDTNERIVKLICLDKSKNESAPVEVVIQPLTPPVELIRKSMNVFPAFGGIFIKWDNVNRANIGVFLYAEDDFGNMVYNDAAYSNQLEGESVFRGFDNTERKFQIQVRDNWDNYSTQLDTVLRPLFEEKIIGRNELGQNLWKQYGWDDRSVEWRGDIANQLRPMEVIWNGFTTGGGYGIDYYNTGAAGNSLHFYTKNSQDQNTKLLPIYFTIDFGKSINFSRHKHWHMPPRPFGNNQVRNYEIWGTNEPPKGGANNFNDIRESLAYWTKWPAVGGTDTWKENWVKLANCDLEPLSGATLYPDITDADKQHILTNGFEFEFDIDIASQPFRYLRFVVNRTWTDATNIQIAEIEFWGSYVE